GHVSVDLDGSATTYEDLANTWLASLGTSSERNNDLLALTNETYQDFALYVPGLTTPPVPEPFTMLTACLAIGGLGMYVRRRSGRSGLAS
ncbi:MAG TPA: hypothetical protein VNA25_20090, partial [Phycisphaerae bacterium]|nr:hypothetical protein [Phycisphaerae bacterium]